MEESRGRVPDGAGKRVQGRAAAAVFFLLIGFAVFLTPAAKAEVIVRLEITADKVSVHLEPSDRSPVVETLARGSVVKLASAMKFKGDWFYILFVSSRSGRTLAGYVPDASVRKLNSTLKVVDLTPPGPGSAGPRALDLTGAPVPDIEWGRTESGILRAEGRPLSREASGDREFLCYHRDVFGKKCLVTYVMIERKLASVRVHLLERYEDKDLYVADYNRIREFLNAKVGEPRTNHVVWKDSAQAERGENLGAAVTSGNLSLSAEWAFRGTEVRLSLTGENSEILFTAEINDLTAKNLASF